MRVRPPLRLNAPAALAAFAVALLALGVSGAQNPASPQTDGYRISGRVIDEVTGEPVSRATVSVLWDDYNQMVASTVSDAEGRFALDHIAAGKYPLSAAKRGYHTSFYDEHDTYNSAIVTGADQDTSHLVFHLAPGAVLRGVISDDGGDPVEGANVLLFRRPAFSASGAHMEQAGNAETDDTGAYEFTNLQSGQYFIAVKADPWYAQHDNRPGPGGQQSPLDVAYSLTYYDSTIDEGSATPVTLTAGGREEADISLRAVPAIRLRIPGTLGAPGTYLSAEQKVFGNVIDTERMQAGDPGQQYVEFTGVAPGTYDLEYGDPPRRATVNAAASLDLDPNSGTPTLDISGKLAMAGGGPVPENIQLELTEAGGGQAPQEALARGGEFDFTAVPPGTWSLRAGSQREPLAVIATSAGGVVSAGDKLVVRDRLPSLVVTLSRAQTDVKGFARKDGKAAPGVMILLVPREPGSYPELARRDQSDSDGSFNLRNVPAGQYTVIAIEEGWKLDWERREVIAPYLRGGLAVTVTDQSGPVVSLAQPVQAVAR
ncbi:MAG TPA: carboxypeptidase-like regulatory domain-containing protein [Candidatus Sulfopaludibacter sp.]|jgi:protocatechuate 3,4-dioxygenase beta subunit|nr:carboxypeptidase-like regulatory domain-containing protein [Candidatus Sulfopaludibacter sp.]